MASRHVGDVVRRAAHAAVMPAAAMLVHQLRYWLAYGPRASIELERQGHSYLHSVAPWIIAAAALGGGWWLRAAGRALGGQVSLPREARSFAVVWLLCAAVLLAMYTGQELLEGMLTGGHAPGLLGVFGFGGWWSIPAVLCVGLVLAALYHGARAALALVASRNTPTAARRRRGILPRRPREVEPRTRPGLSAGWSGRGPPLSAPAAA